MTNIGLGCSKFTFAVYLANTPNMLEYQDISSVNSLVSGEVNAIGQACGNGWRKVFNVYAKLLYVLNPTDFDFAQRAPTWQQYRDSYLLQTGSATALLFSPPVLNANTQTIHIICGRTYAKDLLASGKLEANLVWIDDEFAIDVKNRLVVCPYFDYRQLSNIKIERLSVMLSGLVLDSSN
ncbi:hypothetical protein [Moritella sp. Urea-trap-13]|uniref:DUF6942 family protein n=1 Tax=Moritella sp. Urea-trap-13 TaxID=2058327 RepID=UPI000C334F65|nr:hypothetical protein [Moritella sp. Urea-trap-13]PKH05931.1 hypothetical protein CXF93_08290 [Moritella sp. Urea-trap-13]